MDSPVSLSTFSVVVVVVASGLVGVLVGAVWFASTRGRLRGESGEPPPIATDVGDSVDVARLGESLAREVGKEVAALVRQVNSDVAHQFTELATEKLDARLAVGREAISSTGEQMRHEVAQLGSSLEHLRGVVSRFETDRAAQHADLQAHLERNAREQAKLVETTSALGAVLLNPTVRGAWGERAAADLLARAGLVEGVSFRRQSALKSGSRPDFTFLLPGGRELHMDVKFPADNYLRAIEATDDATRERLESQFLKDVRTCVSGLAKRGYGTERDALDHVVLFIPNEAIHQFLHERDPGLLNWALDRDIILCAPSSLLGVLRVLREAVEAFHLERRSHEILDVLAGIDDQWRLFVEKMDTVGRAVDRLNKSFDELTSTRVRGVQRNLDRVAALRSDPRGPEGGRPEVVAVGVQSLASATVLPIADLAPGSASRGG